MCNTLEDSSGLKELTIRRVGEGIKATSRLNKVVVASVSS